MAVPLAKPCDTSIRAAHFTRPDPPAARRVLWIVLHSTEGDTAEGAARWFANPQSAGSTHLVVDNEHCFRTVEPGMIAWGAAGANRQGFHIEQAGHARWTQARWLKMLRTLQRAAWKTAAWCHRYDLPPTFRTAEGLRAGRPGVTTHAECSKAFGGDHTDPGRFWPRRTFMYFVRRYYAEQG